MCNKARQIGISHSSSAVGVLWGAFHGELTTVISVGQDESDEVLDKARRHAYVLAALGSEMARAVKSNTEELVFASGGRIIALPSSGGRGFTGNVFLDEFAYQEHAAKVWDAAAAVTLLGDFRIRVSSTPNGLGNDFALLWEKAILEDSGWGHHEIPLELAIAQGYPVDLKKAWALAKGDPRLFAQLFKCAFLDGELQYIPSEDVKKCACDLEPPRDGDFYAGLDIGRTNDLTVLIVVRYWRGRRHVVWVDSCKRTDNVAIDNMVARAWKRFNLRRLCIDATGLGYFPAERIKKKYSERIDVPHRRPRVELVDFTLDKKEELATGLYAAFTGESVIIPLTDAGISKIEIEGVCVDVKPGTAEQIKKDVCSIRRIITPAGNVRYDAPRTVEGHADHAWALALALHACSSVNPMIEALTSGTTTAAE